MAKKIIEPGGAADWYTVGQLCKAAAHELVAAHPLNPKAGRIDLYRAVEHDGRRYFVRIKLTLIPAGRALSKNAAENEDHPLTI